MTSNMRFLPILSTLLVRTNTVGLALNIGEAPVPVTSKLKTELVPREEKPLISGRLLVQELPD
jgi:hypothetical protein